jgi:predicted nucleotidyltransferase
VEKDAGILAAAVPVGPRLHPAPTRDRSEIDMELSDVIEKLRAGRGELTERGVRSISVFGSFARDEAGPESDVDLLVEFDRPVSLFEFSRVRFFLEELLGRRVDLVTVDALKDPLRERILGEAVHAA